VTQLTIARRYAKALLAIGKEDKKFSQYNEELKEFSEVLDGNPELVEALINPLYPLAGRKRVMQAVLEKTEFSPIIKSFFNLLTENNRVRAIKDIAVSHQNLVDDLSGVTSATITSASELTEEVVQSIKKAIEKMTKKQVRLEVHVDPGIIGGVITKVGDLNFDGSVKTQLLSLKENLKRGE